MTPNEIVHKAMGLCWCDELYKGKNGYFCVNCHKAHRSKAENPDYSQPEHIGKVLVWLEDELRWYSLEKYYFDQVEESLSCLMDAGMVEFIATVSEWITEGVE